MDVGTISLATAAAFAAATPSFAATGVITVFGNDNPFLAGAASGAACCGGDSAPAESPTLFTGFAGGSSLTFSAVGFTNGAGYGNVGAEGAANFDMGAYNTGVAGARGVGVNSLVGVFLSDLAPSLATQPASLDFSGARDFPLLAPGLAQIFYIGDGLTGVGSGSAQIFIAPTGATRLFLGVADGSGWFNNGGSLAVTIGYTPAAAAPVPEPASWAMMLSGFGLIGARARARRRSAATPAHA